VLVFYLSHRLGYTDDAATILFHMSAMFSFMLCILGAIIADSWLGKFKTILYLSMVYICGCTLLTLGAIGPLQLPANTFTIMGLFFISVGAGGIKPCVASFGGDQFTVPQQLKQLTGFFSLFYFSINAGSFLSVSVTPILREDVHCFGELSCYPLAFGVPAVLMIIAILIFLLGSRLYIIKPAAGNIVVNVSRTIWTAVKTKWQQRHLKSRAHWLDYAAEQHEPQMITDVKIILRVLCLYLPLPLFYALLDQQGSRWTFQAARMNGDVGVWRIKPDQFHIVNPLLILVLIALKDVLINPVLKFLHLSRPLQKISLGGILAGVAFICSGLLELQMEVITAPNELSMLWQLPQYVFIILAELLVSVTGLEFSYAQAPPSMKAVLQACWLLTMGLGNVIVVVIAKLKIFERQSYEFFFYAVLVFIDMLIFMWIAHKY
ncbi:CG9444, partial [Drosophila busckii]